MLTIRRVHGGYIADINPPDAWRSLRVDQPIEAFELVDTLWDAGCRGMRAWKAMEEADPNWRHENPETPRVAMIHISLFHVNLSTRMVEVEANTTIGNDGLTIDIKFNRHTYLSTLNSAVSNPFPGLNGR